MPDPLPPASASAGDAPQAATTQAAAADAARRLLTLARKDRIAASRAFNQLSTDAQVALVCETPLPLRARVLALSDTIDELVPKLPEAELCFLVKSGGVEDASWLLSHASPAQLTSCVDLDAWSGLVPDRAALDRWMGALAEAGDETLLRAGRTLDPEILVLYLRAHVHVDLDPRDEEWQPPPGAQTLEGQFYLTPLQPNDDIAPILALLNSIFREDYWLYFRLLQACIWELEPELEEWALRWRSGRLEDLGFPPWEESMQVYGYLRNEERAQIAPASIPIASPRWTLPVWLPNLPAEVQVGHSLFHAIAELDADDRATCFYAFVALANKVAVADKLDLGDALTLPRTIDKAATLASRGLDWLVQEHGLPAAEIVRRTQIDRLFRIGVNLSAEAGEDPRPEPSIPDDDGSAEEPSEAEGGNGESTPQ